MRLENKNPKSIYCMKRTRVICPDCGSGGANGGPCYCHVCDYRVMMIPCNNNRTYNWIEYERFKGGI